jgi:hypothetical protein
LACTKKYQRQKIIGDEIPSLAGKIPTTFTGFWLLLLDSSNEGQNPTAMANFVRIWVGRIPANLAKIWPFV